MKEYQMVRAAGDDYFIYQLNDLAEGRWRVVGSGHKDGMWWALMEREE